MSLRRAITSNLGSRRRRRAAEPRVESVESRILLATFTVNSNANDFASPQDRFDAQVTVPVGEVLRELLFKPDSSRAFNSSVAIGDFDGDGIGDIAVSIYNTDPSPLLNILGPRLETYVLFGPVSEALTSQASPRASLVYYEAITPAPGAQYTTVSTAGDFNGDGKADIAVGLNSVIPDPTFDPFTTPTSKVGTLRLLVNPGTIPPFLPGQPPAFPASIPSLGFLENFGQIRSLSAGDVNGDGRDDLAILKDSGVDDAYDYDIVGVYPASAQGSSVQLGSPTTFSSPDGQLGLPSSISGVALGRFEASGSPDALDLAISYNTGSTISTTVAAIYRNPGNGQFPPTRERTASFGRLTNALNAGDFDADGLGDLVSLDFDGSVVILPAAGNQPAYTLPGTRPANSVPASIAVGDLNDGAPDLITEFRTSDQAAANELNPQTYSVIVSKTTLRDAINRANQSPGPDTINFRLADPTIRLNTFLPIIISPIAIDGFSQPGARANTLADGDDALPGVVITAPDDAPVFDAFTINRTLSGGTSIRGLVINNLVGSAILVAGEAGGNGSDGGVVIAGNRIGVDRDGTNRRGNGGQGIRLHATSGVTVGGTSPADRNIISGNGGSGIKIDVSGPNLIVGNYIGTDRTGRNAIGNVLDGIQINDSSSITIGGADPSARNILSGNGTNGEGAGVNIDGVGSRNNAILGNYIGVDRDGNGDLGNTLIGVFVGAGASGTTIRDNVITGNGTDDNSGVGVYLYRSSGTTIDRNRIGTTAAGRALAGGSPSVIGVLANDSGGNVIGSPDPANRNVISGHRQIGVYLARETAGDRPIGQGSSNNLVQNNYIGTDFDGLAAIPNGADGVNIANSPNNRVINNLISGNLSTGIQLFGATSVGNVIASNRIGLDANNAPTLPNGDSFPVGIFNNTGGASNTIANNSGQTGVVDGPGVAPAASPGSVATAQNVNKATGKGKKGARQASAAQQRKARQARHRQAASLAARAKAHKVKVSQAHPKGPARGTR
ncbi:hypothetical protein TA3x_003548 [Tundrisphaera sp. TA3]|uniref:hypothetical protein n=1 Tax=Tundrisphaera sp. TA3 TaxID=3435775 RepID=UPI003EB8792C